jgi:hypothetical protein
MSTEITDWLAEKLAAAEQSVRSREQMADSLKSGTDEDWEKARKLFPETRKMPKSTKAERLRDAASHDRIAIKCRHEVAMYKAMDALAASHARLVKALEDAKDSIEGSIRRDNMGVIEDEDAVLLTEIAEAITEAKALTGDVG